MKAYDKVWATAPFLRSKNDSSMIMHHVFLALLFVFCGSVLLFGYAPIIICGVAYITASIVVFISRFFYKSFYFKSDTWKVSIMIFALSLPPTTPWYVVVVGVLSILLFSQLLFAIGSKNVFNPALLGRIVVMNLFPHDLFNKFVFPLPTLIPLIQRDDQNLSLFDAFLKAMHVISGNKTFSYSSSLLDSQDIISGVSIPMISDALTGPTYLISLKNYSKNMTELPTADWFDLFIGNRMGTIGETSVFILLIVFAYFVIKKIIDPWIPIIYVGTIWILSFVFGGLLLQKTLFYLPAASYTFYGGALFVSVFMLTDYGSTPINKQARYFMALLAGILVFIARLKWFHGDPQTSVLLFLNFMAALFEVIFRKKYYGQEKIITKHEQSYTYKSISWSRIVLGMIIIAISFLATTFIYLPEFQSRKENHNQNILRQLFNDYIITEKLTPQLFKAINSNQEPVDILLVSGGGFTSKDIKLGVVLNSNVIENIEILPPFNETRGIGDQIYYRNWETNLIGLTIEDLNIPTLDLKQYAIDVISGATETEGEVVEIIQKADKSRKKYTKSKGQNHE
ncbi:MAG: RnfABCDGE type electron transport complex subunit D [Brevinema sp.]